MNNFADYDMLRVFDDNAFSNNVKKAKSLFKEKLGVVVKANSYGVGIENTLPIFEKYNVKDYFCQDIIEAIKVRKILKTKDCNVYTFAGVQKGQEEEFIKNKIIPLCVSLEQIERFNNFSKKLKQKPKFGIHFDTGMNRTGLSFDEVNKLSLNFEKYTSFLDLCLYISHLHSSYNISDKCNRQQLENFKKAVSILPKCRCSLSATGGSFKLPSCYHFDLVRVGYGIYGVLKGMESVVSVYAKILQIREVKKGQSVGYFAGYKAKRNMKIAILNIGYKDGYSRSLSHTNKWKDKIRAKFKSGANFATSYAVIDEKYKCPIVGIVSMNNIIIDVSNVPTDILNNTLFAEVLGKNANIIHFREANGFIPCDLLTSLLQQNPNALDMKISEFKKLKI